MGVLEREEQRILQETTERESRVGEQRKCLEEFEAGAERLSKLGADLARVHISVEGLSAPSQEIEQQRRHTQALQSLLLNLKEVNALLKEEMEDLRVKVDLLQEAN